MSDTTTTAPPPAPSDHTTAAPSDQSTSAPSSGTTAAPGSETTSGSAPSVQATITITPDDGSSQNPNSVQVAAGATLTLNWTSTYATSVNITGVGEGQPASGSATIPTQDGTITLVAVADGGAQSTPFSIDIATHPDGDVVSGHSDLSSGAAAIVSFTATKDGQTVTHASVGDQVVLTAVVSESTDACTIDGSDAALSDDGNGNKQATATITIADGDSGDYSCTVSAGGTAGDPGSLHLDIGPADNTSTTQAPGSTTTQGPGNSTTQPGTTTTLPPSSSTTSPVGSTTAPPSSTTMQLSDDALQGACWDGGGGTAEVTHGAQHTISVSVDGTAYEGKTVYFVVENSEDGGTTWTKVGDELQATITNSQAQATVQIPADEDSGGGTGSGDAGSDASGDGSDGSGAGSGDDSGAGSGDDAPHCKFRFTASFTSSWGSGAGSGPA